jgi:hypothetical protein
LTSTLIVMGGFCADADAGQPADTAALVAITTALSAPRSGPGMRAGKAGYVPLPGLQLPGQYDSGDRRRVELWTQ